MTLATGWGWIWLSLVLMASLPLARLKGSKFTIRNDQTEVLATERQKVHNQ
jgi:hypothetical protein